MKIQITKSAMLFMKMETDRLEKTIAITKKRIARNKKHYAYKYRVVNMEKVLAKRIKKLTVLKSSLSKLTIYKGK